MPARKSKQTAKRTAKQTTTSRKPKSATAGAAQTRGGRRRMPRVRASWKPVRQPTKDYVLHTFDAGIRLLTHKVPDSKYSEVQNALIAARNQVAASLETVQVPPTKHDYSHLSTTLVNLKDLKQQLEQRHASLTATLDSQERELQKLEDEKVYLQDFGKRPEKHHPLLLGPQEKELHLNFDTVK